MRSAPCGRPGFSLLCRVFTVAVYIQIHLDAQHVLSSRPPTELSTVTCCTGQTSWVCDVHAVPKAPDDMFSERVLSLGVTTVKPPAWRGSFSESSGKIREMLLPLPSMTRLAPRAPSQASQ